MSLNDTIEKAREHLFQFIEKNPEEKVITRQFTYLTNYGVITLTLKMDEESQFYIESSFLANQPPIFGINENYEVEVLCSKWQPVL